MQTQNTFTVNRSTLALWLDAVWHLTSTTIGQLCWLFSLLGLAVGGYLYAQSPSVWLLWFVFGSASLFPPVLALLMALDHRQQLQSNWLAIAAWAWVTPTVAFIGFLFSL